MAKANNTGYNVFVVDMEVNGSVTRQTIDAYRAIYAATSDEAMTAIAWSNPATFQISDATAAHTGTGVQVDGNPTNGNPYVLKLPATITANIVGSLTGTADSAKTLVNAQGTAYSVGSTTLPVYFLNGVPTVTSGTLAVDITGSAHDAAAWTTMVSFFVADATAAHTGAATMVDGSDTTNGYTLKLPATITATLIGNASSADKLNTDAGSTTKPVYFASGVPVACGNTLDVDISGNAATADSAAAFSTSAGTDGIPIYLNASGIPTQVTKVNANLIDGVLSLANIPRGAQERMIKVTDLTAMRALTVTDIDEGDVVQTMDDGQMYYVTAATAQGVDYTNTANTLGFNQFTAGSATYAATAGTADYLSNSPTFHLMDGAVSTPVAFDGYNSVTIAVSQLNANYMTAGILGVAYGGTGKTSWTQYALVYASATNALGQLPLGTADQVLVSGGNNAAPHWEEQANIAAGTAAALATSVAINDTAFDGTASITTAKWGTARNIKIASSDGSNESAAVSVDGSAAVTLKLASTIKANLTGKADTAGTADGLAYQLYVTLRDVNGSDANLDAYGSPSMAADVYHTIGPDNLFNVYKVSGFTTNASAGSWVAITTPSGMTTGSYIVQIKVNGTKFSNEYFTGTMSYSSANAGATQGDSDEVFLHSAGSGSSGERIYFRTRRVGSGKIVMEFCPTTAITSDERFDITFRKMI